MAEMGTEDVSAKISGSFFPADYADGCRNIISENQRYQLEMVSLQITRMGAVTSSVKISDISGRYFPADYTDGRRNIISENQRYQREIFFRRLHRWTQKHHQRKSAISAGDIFPQITQMDAETSSAKISDISERYFSADYADGRRNIISENQRYQREIFFRRLRGWVQKQYQRKSAISAGDGSPADGADVGRKRIRGEYIVCTHRTHLPEITFAFFVCLHLYAAGVCTQKFRGIKNFEIS